MKCPNCGEEMPGESLYCAHCGEDIHIVPDFEPELEQRIAQDINSILDEMQGKNRDGRGEDPEEAAGKPPSGIRRWQAAVAVGMILVVAAAGTAWRIYGHNSVEYQASRGAHYVELGKYDRAVACYTRALELDSGNIELMFSLAGAYFLKNNKIEYEYLLREIVKKPTASTEELESAYGRLIAIYAARGDYQTVNDLLLASNNEAIWSIYQNYMARVPEFSIKEGYYTNIQPLKLTGYGNGKIYYTLDGSTPTKESTLYTAPIILENGDYVISAYFVSDRGIVSDIVTKEYHIEYEVIPEPEVSAGSGEYHFPVRIEVSGKPEGEIYYTTDGSDPTYSSTPYTGPIHMPLGRSNFKFVQIVGGATGLIAQRSYLLELNTDFTAEQAQEVITDYCVGVGKIRDREGRFDDSGAVYQYRYQYVANINGVADFYVIAEIFRSPGGTSEKTGSNYAVNVLTGEFFRLEQDSYGGYALIVIENREPQDTENAEIKNSEIDDSDDEE